MSTSRPILQKAHRHRPQFEDAARVGVRRGGDAARRSRPARGSLLGPLVQRAARRRTAKCAATGSRRPSIRASKARDEDDWYTEYLDAIMAVRVVDGVDGAIAHIANYGSSHTDAIVDGRQGRGREVPARSRQRHRSAQRLDAVRRRRRVRLRRGDRHRDRTLACARAGRRARAHDLQIYRARRWPGSTLSLARRKRWRSLRAARRIGLLGGSFNPAHEAHLHISLIALRRLKLDAVLWLVSPQNPLKGASGHGAARTGVCEHARAIAGDPRYRRHRDRERRSARATRSTRSRR